MEVSLPPKGKGPGPHVHHLQIESFKVTDGVLGVMVADERNELGVGQEMTVPSDTVHDWWNAGGGTVHFVAEVRPALNMEWMLREIFASCNRRASADPSIWDGAYVITQLRGEYSLADVPRLIQRVVFPTVAGIGRVLGLVKVSSRL